MTTLTEADRKLAAGFAGPLETGKLGRIASGNHLAAQNDEPEAINRAALRVGIAVEIYELKAKWMAVGAAFQSEHPACAECSYIATFEGAPGERLCECSLGSRPYDKPSDCPAINLEVEA